MNFYNVLYFNLVVVVFCIGCSNQIGETRSKAINWDSEEQHPSMGTGQNEKVYSVVFSNYGFEISKILNYRFDKFHFRFAAYGKIKIIDFPFLSMEPELNIINSDKNSVLFCVTHKEGSGSEYAIISNSYYSYSISDRKIFILGEGLSYLWDTKVLEGYIIAKEISNFSRSTLTLNCTAQVYPRGSSESLIFITNWLETYTFHKNSLKKARKNDLTSFVLKGKWHSNSLPKFFRIYYATSKSLAIKPSRKYLENYFHPAYGSVTNDKYFQLLLRDSE